MKKQAMNKLASKIAKAEKGKQVSIGNIREILKILSAEMKKDYRVVRDLLS